MITKHDTPAAVLLSEAEFVASSAYVAPAPGLAEHFDILFASTQAPKQSRRRRGFRCYPC